MAAALYAKRHLTDRKEVFEHAKQERETRQKLFRYQYR